MGFGSSEGWLSRLKKGLDRTRVNIVGLFSGGVVDEDFLEELEFALITADIGVDTSSRILQRLRDEIKLKGLRTQEEVRRALRDQIEAILAPSEVPFDVERPAPLVMMMTGVNGAGKTTTIGKLSKFFAAEGKTVLLAAGDTFRAAAREQLAVWGERNRIDVISQEGGDPAAVAFDAVNAGKARGIDVVIVDTAGRLPTQLHLMERHASRRSARKRRVDARARNALPSCGPSCRPARDRRAHGGRRLARGIRRVSAALAPAVARHLPLGSRGISARPGTSLAL